MIKEFPYRIDAKLKHKLDKLASQLNKKDIWILLTGDEGSGKTNTAAYLLYYFHCITGRDFTIENFYFDAEQLFNYAKDTECKLLNWDEAALGGLSSEWYNKAQLNLIKLAITGRKLHHIFVLCIPRFEKLKEELRMDRIHAQIHMDCGKKNNKYGHALYLTRRGIKYLNMKWKKNKIRLYGKAMRMCGGFGCDIPYVFDSVFTKEEQDYYENKKSEAISNIGKKKISPERQELRDLKEKLGNLSYPIKSKQEFSERMGVSIRTVQRWRHPDEKELKTDENDDLSEKDTDTTTDKSGNGGEPIDFD